MSLSYSIRPICVSDYEQWRTLWDGYNAFYGRAGDSALDEAVTCALWDRLFDSSESVHALVAEHEGRVRGLTHYLFHRSTTRLHDVCYLQDLFVGESYRGRGIARALIEAVFRAAEATGSSRVYWQTQAGNQSARALYDKVAKHSGFIVYAKEL